MNASTLRQRLRAGDPASSAQQYSDAESTRLLNEITSSPTTNVVKMRRPMTRGRRIAVAAAIVTALALSPVIKFGLQPPISAAAAEALLLAADSVVATPELHDGQYWKVTTEQWLDDGRETTHIMYSPAMGQGTSYVGILEPRIAPEDSWYRHHVGGDFMGNWQEPNPAFIATLPRDVAGLRAQLYRDTEGHGSTADGSAFTYAMDFLKAGQSDSEIQALVLRVVATIPGVEISTDVKTPDGRSGVGLQHAELLGAYDFLGHLFGEGGLRGKEIILDAKTGEVIGERMYWLGRVVFASSKSRELVDAVPAEIVKMAWPRD